MIVHTEGQVEHVGLEVEHEGVLEDVGLEDGSDDVGHVGMAG